jgi:hypothetical protein
LERDGSSYPFFVRIMANIFTTQTSMKIFTLGCYLLLVISFIHLIGHLILARPQNPAEAEMVQFMQTHVKHVVGGKMTLWDLQTGLNWCHTLFFAGLGSLNLYLSKILERSALKNISRINAIILFSGAVISFIWFFWFPVISFALPAVIFFLCAIRHKPV